MLMKQSICPHCGAPGYRSAAVRLQEEQEQRRALMLSLRWLDGMSLREIGHRFGVSRVRVAQITHRGMRELAFLATDQTAVAAIRAIAGSP